MVITMTDFENNVSVLNHGYRLHKIELYNWGTFDSTKGNIHTIKINGCTTLLIGQNGSGKSTLVDALLTLMVKPVTRNYNVAAGAGKQERSEKTYIKGAYGYLSREDDNHAQEQYLRQDGKTYSVLLACFCNDKNESFSIAQILYLAGDGRVEKVYCFSLGERCISKDFTNLMDTGKVTQVMKKRDFRVATTYAEYSNWFSRTTNIRQMAMDIFNQTVAVKDVNNLDEFIRKHMLEHRNWNEKIDNLQNHFTQLSEAHQSLVRVRGQYELLVPIVKKGEKYAKQAEELHKKEIMLDASDAFFKQKTILMLEPECKKCRGEMEGIAVQKENIDSILAAKKDEERRLLNEIEQSGGARLKEIPLLIADCKSKYEMKLSKNQQFHRELKVLGFKEPVTNQLQMAEVRDKLPKLVKEIEAKHINLQNILEDKVLERGQIQQRIDEDRRELSALEQHQGNLPQLFADVREQICMKLGLPVKDMPFAAELISVKPEARDWEASIEMVLKNYSLSLLVPQRYYSLVSKFIDGTKMADRYGRGQKLVYVRVGQSPVVQNDTEPISSKSLVRKLVFRENHPMQPWIRFEIERKYNVTCCETLEEFQAMDNLALTRQRHFKMRGWRHEKDDRDKAVDRRNFVLGWDNKSKRIHLSSEIEKYSVLGAKLNSEIDNIRREITLLANFKLSIERVSERHDFSEIDYLVHQQDVDSLTQEKESLEKSNDVVRTLKECHVKLLTQIQEISILRDELIDKNGGVKKLLEQHEKSINIARCFLAEQDRLGKLEKYKQFFPECEQFLTDHNIIVEDVSEHQGLFQKKCREIIASINEAIDPLKEEITKLMSRYLHEYQDEKADLGAGPHYLDCYKDILEHIKREDLPRHEQRFKERLNEKVLQEIGLLNGAFQNERTEIITKIQTLNIALKQLEYRPGTYMQLEPKPVREKEINDFRNNLLECISGTFEGSLEACEARYTRIADLLARLRNEPRWREKVTDVRRWYNFAAREIWSDTGKERAYYEDSHGQSGGEKAKLAFTILVAAIAYQYDIDPLQPNSSRFHFVVVDEMFSKVDDKYAEYALELFKKFGLQLLIVAPLDSKAKVTEPYVGCYLHVVKNGDTNHSEVYSMTAREFEHTVIQSVN